MNTSSKKFSKKIFIIFNTLFLILMFAEVNFAWANSNMSEAIYNVNPLDSSNLSMVNQNKSDTTEAKDYPENVTLSFETKNAEYFIYELSYSYDHGGTWEVWEADTDTSWTDTQFGEDHEFTPEEDVFNLSDENDKVFEYYYNIPDSWGGTLWRGRLTPENPETFLEWKVNGHVVETETYSEPGRFAAYLDGGSTIDVLGSWSTDTYTIKYNANGGTGSIPAAQTVTIGESTTIADNIDLEKEYMSFYCWNTRPLGDGDDYFPGEEITPEANMTLYAQWVNDAVVEYNDYFSTSGEPPAPQYKKLGVPITLQGKNTLERTSYVFWSWITNPARPEDGIRYYPGQTYSEDRDLHLYPYWVLPSDIQTVTYDANGASGTVPAQTQALQGDTINAPDQGELKYDNYSFIGWNTQADGKGKKYEAGSSIVVEGNITLYAQWGLSSYAINFNKNGATSGEAPDGLTILLGETFNVPDKGSMKKDSLNFLNWNTQADGSGTSYNVGDLVTPFQNMTLFAIWEATISGTVTNSQNLGIGEASVNIFKKDGSFIGKTQTSSDMALLGEYSLSVVEGTVGYITIERKDYLNITENIGPITKSITKDFTLSDLRISFPIQFVNAEPGPNTDPTFVDAQTGDFNTWLWIMLIACCFGCAALAYFAWTKTVNFSGIANTPKTLSSKPKLNLVYKAIVVCGIIILLIITSITSCLLTKNTFAEAKTNESTTNVAKAIVYEDGHIEVDPFTFINTSNRTIFAKSSTVALTDEYKDYDFLLNSNVQISGLGGTIFKGKPSETPYIITDAIEQLQPNQSCQLKLTLDNIPADKAKSLNSNMIYSISIAFEYTEKLSAKPTFTEEFTYDGKFHSCVNENDAYEVIDGTAQDVKVDASGEVDDYFTSVILKPGYKWVDGTDDVLTYNWRILPATLLETSSDETFTYDTTEHTAISSSVAGLMSRQTSEGSAEFTKEYVKTSPVKITHYYEGLNSETGDNDGILNSANIEFVGEAPTGFTPAKETNYIISSPNLGHVRVLRVPFVNVTTTDIKVTYDGEAHGGDAISAEMLPSESAVQSPVYYYKEGDEYIEGIKEILHASYSGRVEYKVGSSIVIGGQTFEGDYEETYGAYMLEISPKKVSVWFTGTDKYYDTTPLIIESDISGSLLERDKNHLTPDMNYYANNIKIPGPPTDAGTYMARVDGISSDDEATYFSNDYALPEKREKHFEIFKKKLVATNIEQIYFDGEDYTLDYDGKTFGIWYPYTSEFVSPKLSSVDGKTQIRIKVSDSTSVSVDNSKFTTTGKSKNVGDRTVTLKCNTNNNFSGNVDFTFHIYQPTKYTWDPNFVDSVYKRNLPDPISEDTSKQDNRSNHDYMMVKFKEGVDLTQYKIKLEYTLPDGTTGVKYVDPDTTAGHKTRIDCPDNGAATPVYAKQVYITLVSINQ